jgi:hypothetical protein
VTTLSVGQLGYTYPKTNKISTTISGKVTQTIGSVTLNQGTWLILISIIYNVSGNFNIRIYINDNTNNIYSDVLVGGNGVNSTTFLHYVENVTNDNTKYSVNCVDTVNGVTTPDINTYNVTFTRIA